MDIKKMYLKKMMSIPQIAEALSIPRSRVRATLIKEKVALRSRKEGIALQSKAISEALRGRKVEFSEDHKKNIRLSARKRAEKSVGASLKPNGYIEYTRGPNKGRSVHVVEMEKMIGRRIRKGEVVHHIDGNKQNNHINNLALMSRSAHTKLHRNQSNG